MRPPRPETLLRFNEWAHRVGHEAPTVHSLRAPYGYKTFWASTDMHMLGQLCPHYALILCPLSDETVLGFTRWAPSGATMCPLCAHYGTMHLNRLGFQPRGQTMGPLCAKYAPTIRPLCVTRVLGFKRWAHSGATMCPPCAHYALKPFCGEIDVPTVEPPCGHYALTMRPLCSGTVWAFNCWAHSGATTRPLCSQYAPNISSNRFWVKSIAPKMRP